MVPVLSAGGLTGCAEWILKSTLLIFVPEGRVRARVKLPTSPACCSVFVQLTPIPAPMRTTAAAAAILVDCLVITILLKDFLFDFLIEVDAPAHFSGSRVAPRASNFQADFCSRAPRERTKAI